MIFLILLILKIFFQMSLLITHHRCILIFYLCRLKSCSNYSKILKRTTEQIMKEDEHKIEDQEGKKINNETPIIISGDKEESISDRGIMVDASSFITKSSDFLKTESNFNRKNTNDFIYELQNEKILFDEIERKVFKKESILARNIDDSFTREYSILKMVI